MGCIHCMHVSEGVGACALVLMLSVDYFTNGMGGRTTCVVLVSRRRPYVLITLSRPPVLRVVPRSQPKKKIK